MSDPAPKRRLSDTALIVLSFLALFGALAFLFLQGEGSPLTISPSQFLPFLAPSSPSQPPSVPPSDACTGASCPAGILDLAAWKLTLPIRSEQSKKAPLEIRQPKLASYSLAPWFRPTADRKGVIFRAPVGAPTTGDSEYPRSELREMSSDGKDEIAWPSTEGVHTLFLDQAITAVPKSKPHVVAGQIHGDDDDLLVIRLEHPVLSITRGGKNVATLDEHYVLGKRFTIRFVAHDGRIDVYYDGSTLPVYTLEKKVKMAYFKAGVYTQSNCETEDGAGTCTTDNYGEVVIYHIAVTHE